MLAGTLRVFLAETLLLPSGLLIAAFLSRRLGPEGFGLFALAGTLVAWVEWTIAAVFARATVKVVSDAADWRPVAGTVAGLQGAIGAGAALVLILLAGPIARLLGEPVLAGYLRLFALDVPLFALAQAHRNVLVALGGFGARALTGAGRHTARLVLIVAFVQLGLTVEGAILGSLGASVVELAIGRFHVRPPLLARSRTALRTLGDLVLPLFLAAMSLRLFDKLDLFTLKALGGTAALAGIYAAAQNFSLVPGIFALSFSPLILSTVSRALRAGDATAAAAAVRQALRATLLLLPLGAAVAGAAPEIVDWVLGPSFHASAPLLRLLIFGALGLVTLSVTTSILIAGGRPGLTFALTGPLVPLALAGQLLLIPRLGASGAALVTVACAVLAALASLAAVRRCFGISPPGGTVVRSLLACAPAFAIAYLWPAPDLAVVAKLAVAALASAATLTLLGEVSPGERAWLRGALVGRIAGGRSG